MKKKQTVRYRKRRHSKQALKGGFKKIYMVDLSGSCDRQIIFDDIPSDQEAVTGKSSLMTYPLSFSRFSACEAVSIFSIFTGRGER